MRNHDSTLSASSFSRFASALQQRVHITATSCFARSSSAGVGGVRVGFGMVKRTIGDASPNVRQEIGGPFLQPKGAEMRTGSYKLGIA
jgi:hypothetical protein